MAQAACLLFVSCLTLFLTLAGVAAQQTCPGVLPWRPLLKCPQFCCVRDTDDPLDDQYCCSSCRSSFDPATRNAFSCTASIYLRQTWAVVLMSCGIAFIILVCCTCCCCCCCAPCRGEGRRRRAREYTLTKQPAPHHQHYRNAATSYYGSCGSSSYGSGSVSDASAVQHPRPSAPPASGAAATACSPHPYPQKNREEAAAAYPQHLPPPYQAQNQHTGVSATSSLAEQPQPPVYQP